MNKIILTLIVTLFLTSNTYSAGSSSSSSSSSNYDKAVKLIKSAKKYEQKDKVDKAKKNFEERFTNIDWNLYCDDLPFNLSALSLYKWAPIAEELKSLDRKIVLNSMILKWDIIKDEFKNLIQF